MKTKLNRIAVLGLVLVVGAGMAWIVARRQQAAAAALTTLAENRKSLESAIGRAEARLRAADAAKSATAPAPSPAAQPKPASVAKKNPDDTLPNEVELITSDPKLELLELDRQRAEVMLSYGQFFGDFGLAPDKVAKFRENRVAWYERLVDLNGAAGTMDEASQRTIARLKEEAKAEYEAKQAELLGPADYARLQEYDRTVMVRSGIVDGLAGSAAVAGIPLTARQGDQLLQAAVELLGNFTREQSPEALQRLDWSAFDAKAREILTPEQFALFSSAAAPTLGGGLRWKLQLEAAAARAMQTDPTIGRTLRRN
jgi:hypothetical protein